MKLRFPITVPHQIRTSRIRRARVTAMQCAYCGLWVKPRYLRTGVCRRCEATGANQTWKPTPAHLKRAHELAAREHAARQAARLTGFRREHTTLAGR